MSKRAPTPKRYRICDICRTNDGKSLREIGAKTRVLCVTCKTKTQHTIMTQKQIEDSAAKRNHPKRFRFRRGSLIGLGLGVEFDENSHPMLG